MKGNPSPRITNLPTVKQSYHHRNPSRQASILQTEIFHLTIFFPLCFQGIFLNTCMCGCGHVCRNVYVCLEMCIYVKGEQPITPKVWIRLTDSTGDCMCECGSMCRNVYACLKIYILWGIRRCWHQTFDLGENLFFGWKDGSEGNILWVK